jgi:diketogulonate reductase-like aldo/keto reductase
VALAWVQSRPGVTSTILGARTLQQLEDNLGALDVTIPAEQLTALHEVSRPTLNFPAEFLVNIANFAFGGATINGRSSSVIPFLPQNDQERY